MLLQSNALTRDVGRNPGSKFFNISSETLGCGYPTGGEVTSMFHCWSIVEAFGGWTKFAVFFFIYFLWRLHHFSTCLRVVGPH